MNESKQARQHDELIAELLDSRVPKTEREHAATREIERLRGLCDDLYSDVLAAGSLTPRDCGAYSLIQETIRLRRDRWARPMQPNQELSRHGLADTTSYGKPILRKGIGAFAETVSTLAPGIEIRRIVDMLIMQALTDFIVASEAYRNAVRTEEQALQGAQMQPQDDRGGNADMPSGTPR